MFSDASLFVTLTKGVVEQIVDPYTVKVRLPIFNKSSDAPQSTPTNELYDAKSCVIPNCNPNYQVGDIVYVTFEDNDIGKPVILGMLYSSKPTSTYPDFKIGNLESKYKTELCSDTSIGSITSKQVNYLKNLRENIQTQFDIFEPSSKPEIVLPQSMIDYFGITYSDEKLGAIIELTYENSSSYTINSTDVEASLTNPSAPGLTNGYKYVFTLSNYGYWTFVKTPIIHIIYITDADAFGATKPIDGNRPVLSNLYTNSDEYTVNYTNNYWYSSSGVPYSNKFVEDDEYYILVTFLANSGYAFDSSEEEIIPYMGDKSGEILAFESNDTVLKCKFTYTAESKPQSYGSFWCENLNNSRPESQYKYSTYFVSAPPINNFMLIKDGNTLRVSSNVTSGSMSTLLASLNDYELWQDGTYAFSVPGGLADIVLTYSVDTNISVFCGKAPDYTATYTSVDRTDANQCYTLWNIIKSVPYNSQYMTDYGVASLYGNIHAESAYQSKNIVIRNNNEESSLLKNNTKYSAYVFAYTVSADVDEFEDFLSQYYIYPEGTSYSFENHNRAYGLAQWLGSRKGSLLTYVKQNYPNKSVANTEAQIDYLVNIDMGATSVRRNTRTLLYNQDAKNVIDPTAYMLVYFEAPGSFTSYKAARQAYFGNDRDIKPNPSFSNFVTLMDTYCSFKSATQTRIGYAVEAFNKLSTLSTVSSATFNFKASDDTAYANRTLSVVQDEKDNCGEFTFDSTLLPTKQGCKFLGWDTNKQGIEMFGLSDDADGVSWALPKYYSTDKIRILKSQPNTTFYPIFKYHNILIKYKDQNGNAIDYVDGFGAHHEYQLILHNKVFDDTNRRLTPRINIVTGIETTNYTYDNMVMKYNNVSSTWSGSDGNTYTGGYAITLNSNSDAVEYSETAVNGHHYTVNTAYVITLTLVSQ